MLNNLFKTGGFIVSTFAGTVSTLSISLWALFAGCCPVGRYITNFEVKSIGQATFCLFNLTIAYRYAVLLVHSKAAILSLSSYKK